MPEPPRDVIAPPSDETAERSVLGALLLDDSLAPAVFATVSEEDFHYGGHRAIFRALLTLHEDGRPLDPALLGHELSRSGTLEMAGGPEAIPNLMDAVPSSANAMFYVGIVADLSARRRLLRAADATLRTISDNGLPVADLRARAIAAFDAIALPGTEGDRFLSVPDVLAVDPEEEWAWQGFLAFGEIVLVMGLPKKAGKSFWIYALARAMETGAPFLGRPTKKSPVLIFSEEGKRSIRKKVRLFGLSEAAFLTRSQLHPRKPFSALCEEARRKAEKMGARVIVLDTALVWSNLAEAGAENDAATIQQVYNPLMDLAGRGYAIVIVHHSQKADTGPRGSNALEGLVDSTIHTKRVQGEPDDSTLRELTLQGRASEMAEEPIVVDLVTEKDDQGAPIPGTGRYELKGTVKEARIAVDSDFVLGELEANPWSTAQDLVDATDGKADVGHIRFVCKTLVRKGLLVVSSEKPFRWALAGSEAAARGFGEGTGRARKPRALFGDREVPEAD